MALPSKLVTEIDEFTQWWNYHCDHVAKMAPENQIKFFLNGLNQQNYLLVELARAVHQTRDPNAAGLLVLPKLAFGGRAP